MSSQREASTNEGSFDIEFLGNGPEMEVAEGLKEEASAMGDLDPEDILKDIGEEDDEDDSLEESGESEDNEASANDLIEDGDANQTGGNLTEEALPVSLDLKSGDWELRDTLLWPVTLPVDLIGNECNEYVEYNLKDPRIDLFALRTVEEMDFPIGFDVAIAKSIRAQLMSLIPILWKERQSVMIQERRSAQAQRRTETEASKAAGVTPAGVQDDEAMVKAITSTTVYPMNAVRRLLKGLVSGETPNELNQTEDDRMDTDEGEAANIKKRKRAPEDDATGRKKRKRGTAFEAHNLVDERVAIRLNLSLAGVQLQDQFDWDPATPLYWTDIFARRLVTEIGLPREFETAIAFDIKRQVLAYLGFSSHQLPPDWVPSSQSNLSQSHTQLTSSKPGPPNASSNSPYFPTRSLPILSLHNVIRPPQISSSFSPSLNAHSPSQQKWDMLNSRQRSRSARLAAAASSSSAPSSHPIPKAPTPTINRSVGAPSNPPRVQITPTGLKQPLNR